MQWPPRPGPGIEGLEAEGLGLGSLDDLPDVDPHAIEDDLQLVDQGDVDGPIRVLEDLARLGRLTARHRDDARHGGGIETPGQQAAPLVEAADDLGDVRGRVVRVAGILALGAVGEEEVAAGDQSAGLQFGAEHVPGRSWVGRALQDDELTGSKMPTDGPAGVDDSREVRLAMPTQGGRYADQNGIGLGQRAKSLVASKRPWSRSAATRFDVIWPM